MAYMNQEKKRKIAAQLKKVVPSNWKYSLKVRHHSTIVMTVRKGPAELMVGCNDDHWDVNEYYLDRQFGYDAELLEAVKKVVAALNLNNHDNSDAMTDYFDVGHYVEFRFGEWNKPFQVVESVA